MDFVSWVRQQDPSRLKYLDESHFENWGNLYVHLFAQNCMHVCFADCSRWQYCRGPRGQRVTRTRHMSEAARTSFSVTYMTSLTHPRGGVLLSIREGSNDAIDYFESLVDACHNNHLREGDILVVDNAKVHGAAQVADLENMLFAVVGVTSIRVPAYFPELMPPGLVFQNVKRYMRAHRGFGTFREEILKGFACGTCLEFVARQYRLCIPQ